MAVRDLLPQAERMALMDRGVIQLRTWLHDLLTTGILEHDFSEEFLSEVASRMVDAKMGAIARRIRLLANLDRSDPQWVKILQDRLSQLYLFTSAWRNFEEHSLALKLTLLQWAGLTIKKHDLDPAKGIDDVWYPLSIHERMEEQLRMRRVWLAGLKTRRIGLLIDYAFGRNRFDHDYNYEEGFQAKLNYYPSTFPIRASLSEIKLMRIEHRFIPGFSSIQKFLDQFATALSKNPWIGGFPCPLIDATLSFDGHRFIISDAMGDVLPVVNSSDNSEALWAVVASGGGHPITLFGEWNGNQLNISSYLEQGRIVALSKIS